MRKRLKRKKQNKLWNEIINLDTTSSDLDYYGCLLGIPREEILVERYRPVVKEKYKKVIEGEYSYRERLVRWIRSKVDRSGNIEIRRVVQVQTPVKYIHIDNLSFPNTPV